MTGPQVSLRADEDPLDALKALKQRSATDPLDELKAMKAGGHDFHAEYRSGALAKRMTGANTREAQNLADEQASTPSLLERIHQGVNSTMANIGQVVPGMEAAQAGIASLSSRLPSMGGARSYQQSLKDVQEQVGAIPTPTRLLGKALAGPALAAGGPANPAVLGGILGYADAALSPDMTQGHLERFGKGTVGAVGGIVAGHVLGKIGTSIQAARTPTPEANILARQAARAESAARLYGAAQTEGEQNGANQAVRSFIQEPEIASRIEQLQSLEQYKNTAADSPEMMAALARSMSDEAKTLQKGMGQIDPSKPNTLREKATSLGLLKKRLINTVSNPSTTTKPPITMDVPGESTIIPSRLGSAPFQETAQSPHPDIRTAIADFHARPGIVVDRREGTVAQQMARQALERHGTEGVVSPPLTGQPSGQPMSVPRPYQISPSVGIQTPAMRVQTAPAETVTESAMMPSFREASQDFARRTAEINAVGKGMNASQGNVRPSFKQIMSKETKTPLTFDKWYQSATEGEKQAAIQGLLGDVKNAYKASNWRLGTGREAAGRAGDILRRVDPSSSQDVLKALGILNIPFANR